jgi:hypothetical protein
MRQSTQRVHFLAYLLPRWKMYTTVRWRMEFQTLKNRSNNFFAKIWPHDLVTDARWQGITATYDSSSFEPWPAHRRGGGAGGLPGGGGEVSCLEADERTRPVWEPGPAAVSCLCGRREDAARLGTKSGRRRAGPRFGGGGEVSCLRDQRGGCGQLGDQVRPTARGPGPTARRGQVRRCAGARFGGARCTRAASIAAPGRRL